MAKKKKTSLVAVREKVKKPKNLNFGSYWADAWIDGSRLRGNRRSVNISVNGRDAKDLRRLAEFCKQAADWMEDDK
jgi:hypothetical protein